MDFESNPVITEDEKRLLADIETAVKSLVGKGWRAAHGEVSERHFINGGNTLHSLKLELRKGPLMMDGC
jgi:thiamine phosphate synthase YjbQ (UPF0047 family)